MCYKYHLMVTSPADYPSLIPYIFSPSPIILFVFLVVSAVADYSKDRVEEGIPLHLR